MMKQIIIYDFPESHLCEKCVHGVFFQLEQTTYGFDHFCSIGCKKNNGKRCPRFKDDRPSADVIATMFEGLSDHYGWAEQLDIDEVVGRLSTMGYVRDRH